MSKQLSLLLAPLILGATPLVLAAQDISYTTTTRAEFGGALGRVMRVVPGGTDPTVETTSIHERLMRVDHDESSTIMEMESLSFTFLNHTDRTYWTMDWSDAGAMWEQSARVNMPERERSVYVDDENRRTVTYETSFDVDRTGDRERINGYMAERVFFTLTIDATEEYAANPDSVVGGTMVLLTEMWISDEFPAYEALMEMRPGGQVNANANPMALQYDPRIGSALQRLQEEMDGLDGLSMKTVSHFVIVPMELDFDRDAVLRDADRSLMADVAGAVVSGAAGAVRRGLGGLTRGLFGRRSEPERPAPQQAVIMRVTAEIHDVSEAPLDPGIFVRPENYQARDVFSGMDANN